MKSTPQLIAALISEDPHEVSIENLIKDLAGWMAPLINIPEVERVSAVRQISIQRLVQMAVDDLTQEFAFFKKSYRLGNDAQQKFINYKLTNRIDTGKDSSDLDKMGGRDWRSDGR